MKIEPPATCRCGCEARVAAVEAQLAELRSRLPPPVDTSPVDAQLVAALREVYPARGQTFHSRDVINDAAALARQSDAERTPGHGLVAALGALKFSTPRQVGDWCGRMVGKGLLGRAEADNTGVHWFVSRH